MLANVKLEDDYFIDGEMKKVVLMNLAYNDWRKEKQILFFKFFYTIFFISPSMKIIVFNFCKHSNYICKIYKYKFDKYTNLIEFIIL